MCRNQHIARERPCFRVNSCKLYIMIQITLNHCLNFDFLTRPVLMFDIHFISSHWGCTKSVYNHAQVELIGDRSLLI